MLLVRQHEIEHGETPADEVQLMCAAIAEVLFIDGRIEPSREEVIDNAAQGITFPLNVFLGLELVPIVRGALAPMSPGKAKELAGHEIAGLCGHDVKKTSYLRGVA